MISSSLSGDAVLGLIPTGGGKSLCFQSPGLIDEGCTIVVCPITALVRDHVLELKNFGVIGRADFVASEVQGKEKEYIFSKLSDGTLKFLFVSPEQFQTQNFRNRLSSLASRKILKRIVIDEVHCISEWGHDFRTAYLNLADTIRTYADNVPVLCLTATAALKVIEDIRIEFNIPDENIVYSMDNSRGELNFEVIQTNKN